MMIKDFIKKQIRKTGMIRALELENEKLEFQINHSQNELTNLKNQINHLEKEKLKVIEHKTLLEEKEKLCTVPNFEDLKLSLKGKDGYLFLVNDSNNEIRQHFDQSYVNNFNSSFFIENLKYKEEYCKNNNIKYFFFLVPDKSYVCRDLLPFDIKLIKRNYDLIKHLVPDFSEKLDQNCYWNTDSHINFLGGKELSYNMLNYMDKNLKRNDFNKLIQEQTIINDVEFPTGDLTSADNWSYSDKEKEGYSEKTQHISSGCLIDLKETLPEKFKSSSNRETSYYQNKNGFTNLKVLILRDSSTIYLDNVLSVYFKEMLLYWDHWIFNKEIIEWYKPDVILEIRTERFLENMETAIKIQKNKN